MVKSILLLLSLPFIRGALRASHRNGQLNSTASEESPLHRLDDEILCRVVKIMEAEQDGTDLESFGCDPIYPEVPGTYDLPSIPHLTEQVSEPLLKGNPVYLKDVWPSNEEVQQVVDTCEDYDAFNLDNIEDSVIILHKKYMHKLHIDSVTVHRLNSKLTQQLQFITTNSRNTNQYESHWGSGILSC